MDFSEARNLRQEQDREYQEALERDREKVSKLSNWYVCVCVCVCVCENDEIFHLFRECLIC